MPLLEIFTIEIIFLSSIIALSDKIWLAIPLLIYLITIAYSDSKEAFVYRICHKALVLYVFIFVLYKSLFLGYNIVDGKNIIALSVSLIALIAFALSKAMGLGDILAYASISLYLILILNADVLFVLIYIITSQLLFLIFNIKHIKTKTSNPLCPYMLLSFPIIIFL